MPSIVRSGLFKHTLGFLASTVFAILGSLLLLVGVVIWTVIVKKAEDINTFLVGQPSAPVDIGITVSIGDGIILAWVATACLVASSVPYMIRYVSLQALLPFR